MSDLFAARCQMALSLGFHILFAVAGMAMPLFMVIAEVLYLRTGKAVYYELARRWAKGTAILFAVGAVSGTVLSFELGLLWPTFMRHAGPLIGMPFSLEGFAFFLEGIGIFALLYFGTNPVLFVILSGLVFFAWGEIYSLFPATCTDIFGRKFATTNYGMLYTAKGTASLLVPLANVLTNATGSWHAVFYVAAFLNIVAAVMAIAVLKPMRLRAMAQIEHRPVQEIGVTPKPAV